MKHPVTKVLAGAMGLFGLAAQAQVSVPIPGMTVHAVERVDEAMSLVRELG